MVLERMTYEERLRHLGFLSLRKRGLREDLTVVFSYLMEGNREDKNLRGAQKQDKREEIYKLTALTR